MQTGLNMAKMCIDYQVQGSKKHASQMMNSKKFEKI